MTVYWQIMDRFMYPYLQFYTETLKNLEIPFWNPYLSCGTPFMAMLQTQVFYPFNLLFVILPFPAALNIHIIIHTCLAGFFTFLLMRYNAFGKTEALLASVVFMFNGFFAYHIEFIHHMSAYVWLPLIFLYFQKSLMERKIQYYLFTALLLAVQFFAGYPQFSYFTVLILGMYFLFNLFSFKTDKKTIQYKLLTFSVILTSFAGLILVQILPTLELTALSERAGGMNINASLEYSMTFKEMLTYFFIPVWNIFYSLTLHDAQTTGFYFGIFCPVLVLFAFINKSERKTAYFFGFITLLGLALALGKNTFLYSIFLKYFPGMAYFRFPVQCLYFAVFGITILSAMGLKAIKNKKVQILILLIFLGEFYFFGRNACNLIDSNYFKNVNNPSWLAETVNTQDYRILMNPLTLDKLKNYTPKNYNDCVNYRDTRIINYGMLNNLYDANGYIILGVRSYEVFLSELFKQGYNSKLLNLIGVKYLISERDMKNPVWKPLKTTDYGMNVYKNSGALPRTMFFTRSKTFATDADTLRYMKSSQFTPENEIIFTQAGLKEPFSTSIAIPQDADIITDEYSPNRITLYVYNKTPGWLFLSDTYYPGWKVYINGKKGNILKADYTFRAVLLDTIQQGEANRIDFVYNPVSYKLGLNLSLITLMLILIILIKKQVDM